MVITGYHKIHEDDGFDDLDQGVREEPRGAEEVDSQRGGAQPVGPRAGEVLRHHFHLSSLHPLLKTLPIRLGWRGPLGLETSSTFRRGDQS